MFDDLFVQVLFEFHEFFVEPHQLLLAPLFIDMGDDIQSKVQDTFEVARREVEQETNTAGRSLEVPDVTDGGSQFDVSHTLAAHLGARNFDTAFIADNALKAHTFIFTAVAFPVLSWAKDALTEQAVFFRLECAVVDGFRFRNLAVAPPADLLRAGKADAYCVKIVDFEHVIDLLRNRTGLFRVRA